MAFVYNEVGWENLPSTNTPRNATNLGNMDTGIKENNNMLNGASPMGNVIVESIETKNMFNKINVIIGAYVAGWSGNLEDNANCVTGYIECEPNTTYTLSKIADYTFGYATCDHIPAIGDSLSQILIEGQGVTHATITTNSTAKYILFWFYWSDQDTNSYENNLNSVQCEKGSVATAYSPYQNLNGMEIYSSSEIVVGSFLGKPLYRKVFTGTFAGGTSTYTIVNDILPITCTVRNLYGTTYPSNGNAHRRPINFYFELNNASSFIGTWAVCDSGNSRWNLSFHYSQAYNTLNYEAIVEYTKTTD